VALLAIALECGQVVSAPDEASVVGIGLSIALGAVVVWRRHAPVLVLVLTLVLTAGSRRRPLTG
jgi:hypothetical protein